jgi:hypothetical protein
MLLNKNLLMLTGIATVVTFSVLGKIRKVNRLSQESRQAGKALATWEEEGGNLPEVVGATATEPVMPVSSTSR